MNNDNIDKQNEIKAEIMHLVSEYFNLAFPEKSFEAGKSPVPVSGKVIDAEDIQMIIESGLDGWFTTGRFNTIFEQQLSKFIGIPNVLTVNSGSSANHIAVTALTDRTLGERAIKAGDEVITVAVSFPTTINPWLIHGVVPVFVDIDIPTYNIKINEIEEAITPKTKAIMVAHTLGNPFDVEKVAQIAKKHNLWLIEDCCDALGSQVNGKHVGTFGDIGTLSFYPAHHITMGEGGAVFTRSSKLASIMESFRDWGRDCWCASGCDNTCGKRFDWQLGELPKGYDHKYIYSRIGYNMKITDMQAALGVSQLRKLNGYISARKANFEQLTKILSKHSNQLILPTATENTTPSWFGYLITLSEDCRLSRQEIIAKLTDAKIATRLLFAGDIRKQPYFSDIKYRNASQLINTEIVLHRTFWIGVTPMIDSSMINYVGEIFNEILK